MRSLAPLLILLLALTPGPGRTEEELDFHRIFEARCASCHGHAGPFAQSVLRLDGDTLLRSDGRPLAPFLKTHMGGLSTEELNLFIETFRNQVGSGGLYRETCIYCHDRAYEFARKTLILKDGVLMGRYSGYLTGEFLQSHARLTPDEARAMTEAFEAVLKGAR